MGISKSFAFTLAEVLITLGVIGVVAAMTIPGLITAYKKHETAAKLKRAVSVINQAIRLSEQENGEMENWDKTLTDEKFIDTYFRPFMTIMQVCSSSNTCGYSRGSAWKTLKNTYSHYANPFYRDRQGMQTSDGIVYFYSKVIEGTSANDDKMIIIDINGSDNPNTFGKDVFFCIRDEDADSIIPYGSGEDYDKVKKDCSTGGSGYYCAVLIKENGWNIPSGYPKL